MNLIGHFSLRVPRVSRRKPRESSRGSKPCPANAPLHVSLKGRCTHEGEDVPMKGKRCQWRGRCANEEEDVPMKWNMWPWRGRCAHEVEYVAMKGKMCPWRGRCAHEEEDVPMKRKMWPWRCGNSRFKKLKTRAFAKAFRESKLPAKARVRTLPQKMASA